MLGNVRTRWQEGTITQRERQESETTAGHTKAHRWGHKGEPGTTNPPHGCGGIRAGGGQVGWGKCGGKGQRVSKMYKVWAVRKGRQGKGRVARQWHVRLCGVGWEGEGGRAKVRQACMQWTKSQAPRLKVLFPDESVQSHSGSKVGRHEGGKGVCGGKGGVGWEVLSAPAVKNKFKDHDMHRTGQVRSGR